MGQRLALFLCNPAYKQWFGVDAHNLPGTSLRELLGSSLFNRNEPYITAALRGEFQEFERVIEGPDKSRHSLARYTPDVRSGRVVGFFVEVSDISALKKVEAALLAKVADLEQRNIFYQYLIAKRSGPIRFEEDSVRWSNEAMHRSTVLTAQIAHEMRNALVPSRVGPVISN